MLKMKKNNFRNGKLEILSVLSWYMESFWNFETTRFLSYVSVRVMCFSSGHRSNYAHHLIMFKKIKQFVNNDFSSKL
jgi:hypothetical protein